MKTENEEELCNIQEKYVRRKKVNGKGKKGRKGKLSKDQNGGRRMQKDYQKYQENEIF